MTIANLKKDREFVEKHKMDQLEFINLSFKYILRESPKDVRKDCEDPARSCQHLNFGLS